MFKADGGLMIPKTKISSASVGFGLNYQGIFRLKMIRTYVMFVNPYKKPNNT